MAGNDRPTPETPVLWARAKTDYADCMRRRLLLCFALCGLALVPVAEPSSRFVPSIVTLDGVGDVQPGLAVGEVERRFGINLHPAGFGPNCTRASFRSGIVRGNATFVRGRLGALWFDRGVIAGRGIGIGATLAAIRRAYRRVETRRDPELPGVKNVFVSRTRAPHWRLRFDLSPQGRVTRIAYGGQSVLLADGCP